MGQQPNNQIVSKTRETSTDFTHLGSTRMDMEISKHTKGYRMRVGESLLVTRNGELGPKGEEEQERQRREKRERCGLLARDVASVQSTRRQP